MTEGGGEEELPSNNYTKISIFKPVLKVQKKIVAGENDLSGRKHKIVWTDSVIAYEQILLLVMLVFNLWWGNSIMICWHLEFILIHNVQNHSTKLGIFVSEKSGKYIFV